MADSFFIKVFLIAFASTYVWIMIIILYHAVTTNKRICITNDIFKLESNRKKYAYEGPMSGLISWREVYVGDWGRGIKLEFEDKKITLGSLEFKNFSLFETYLDENHQDKKY